MKTNIQYRLLHYFTLFILAFSPHFVNVRAQSCVSVVPPTTINGVAITANTTGAVNTYPNPWTSCSAYTTPSNSVHLGPGAFNYTLNFSAPVNCLNFILTATGQGGNEDFTFTTNSGTPTIVDNSSCYTTITGNTLLSGASAPNISNGGGGDFTIVNPLPFTSLTITGSGPHAGSLFAICAASINSNTIIEDSLYVCDGDSVYFDGSYQTSAAVFSDTVYGGSICGGDSITNTHIIIMPLPSPTINPIADQCESLDSVPLIGNPSGGVFSGNGVTGSNFNPSVAGVGTHTITYEYTDGNSCINSTTIDITVKQVPPLIFEPLDNLCINGNSVSLIGNPTGGMFSGNGVIGNNFDPGEAGTGSHTLSYEHTFSNGCTAVTQIVVSVNEIPAPVFEGDNLLGCKAHTVQFTNITGLTNEICTWDFGDGITSNDCDSVLYTYNSEGIYDVTLTIESQEGCLGSTTFTDYIEVLKGPTANFTANPMITNYNETEVLFTNESTNASSFTWEFGDNSAQVFETNPSYLYPNGIVDDYYVTLYAMDSLGCIDSTTLLIQVIFPDLEYELPNVFTPNGDSENDIFKLIKADNISELEIIILNRWGNLVFESTEVNFKWNGLKHNTGEHCTDGTYFYKIKLNNKSGSEVEGHGFIHLSRGE